MVHAREPVASRQHFDARGVGVTFGACAALAGVDLAIAPGERVALVGPSGAGKTTLLRLLGAAIVPTSGRLAIGGADVASLRMRELRSLRSTIGFVHQDHALVPNVRVVQNVVSGRAGCRSLAGSIRDFVWPSRATLVRIHALLDRVGIEDKLFERTDRLSGGQRQRVAIARALFQQPATILADEPVASVDPSRARDTLELLRAISRDDGITLCASLHNVEYAREYFDRVIGLRAGRVVFDRRSVDVDPETTHRLFELAPDEMLADGC